jgi:hypothetical protein
MIFFAIFGYRIFANQSYKQQLIINSGHERENIVRFSDTIQGLSSNKSESTHQYAQITKIYETKDLIILSLGWLVGIPLKKDGFTLGNYQEFIKFLQKKCPGVRIS